MLDGYLTAFFLAGTCDANSLAGTCDTNSLFVQWCTCTSNKKIAKLQEIIAKLQQPISQSLKITPMPDFYFMHSHMYIMYRV